MEIYNINRCAVDQDDRLYRHYRHYSNLCHIDKFTFPYPKFCYLKKTKISKMIKIWS